MHATAQHSSVAFYMAQAPHYAESCCTFLFCVFNQLEDRLTVLVVPMTVPHVQALHQSLSKKLIHALFEDRSQYIHSASSVSFSFSNLVGTFCKKLEEILRSVPVHISYGIMKLKKSRSNNPQGSKRTIENPQILLGHFGPFKGPPFFEQLDVCLFQLPHGAGSKSC